MKKQKYLFWITGWLLCAQLTFAESPTEPKTASAVIAADEAWGDAEKKGDADFVAQLLLPEYRSISADGKVVTKATITGKMAVLIWVADNPSAGRIASCDIFVYRDGH